jgi:hypothetical protein
MWPLDCIPSDGLPRLAWCALLRRRESRVLLYHGLSVDTDEDSFVEGAWSGDYGSRKFAHALTFTGSGGVVTPHGLLLATPTHTLEALYVLQTPTSTLCSNSLPFLLNRSGDDIDPGYLYYDTDIMSVALGLQQYRRRIPTRDHNWVHLYYHCNLIMTNDLAITQHAKRRHGPFRNFSNYRALLKREVAAVITNAAAADRAVKYTPLATISTGYDSPACAVLARSAGCVDAVTFTNAREEFQDRSDSGRVIGELLGLKVAEYDPAAYFARQDLPEAEFAATGTGGADVIMSTLESRLPETLLFTGFQGDKVWAKVSPEVGPDIVRADAAGASMTEFRLRVGFLHCPIPFIGCQEHESIQSISNDSEMQPWSVGVRGYDRPIPRRIVEESGVPRQLFGQSKKAAARLLQHSQQYNLIEPDLRHGLSPTSYTDFKTWAQQRKLFRDQGDWLYFSVMHTLYRLNARVLRSRTAFKVCKLIELPYPTVPTVPWRFGKRRTDHRLLFHWGMDRISGRYNISATGKHSDVAPRGCS